MLMTFLVVWTLITLASALGCLSFLALDQWQVGRLEVAAQRPAPVTRAEVAQVA
jgi:hypothetical protein